MTVSGLLPYIRHQKLKGRIKADGPEVLALQTRSSMEEVVKLLQQNGYDINNTVHVIDAAAITFGQYQQLRDGVQYAPLNIAKEKVACGIEAAIEAYVLVIQQSFGPGSRVCVVFDHEHLRPRLKEETDKKRMLTSWRKKESQRRWADKHRKGSKDPTAMELDVEGEIAPRVTKHKFQQGMPKRALLAGTPWSEVEVPFPLERARAFCDTLGIDSIVAQGEADPLVANKIREFRASHPASQLYVHAVDSDAVVMLRAIDSEVLIAPKKLVKLEVLFRVAFESSTEWSRLTSLDAQLAFALLVGHDFSKGLLNIGPVKLIESGKLVTLCNADWFSYTEADFHDALKHALEGTWQQQIDQSRVPSLEHMRRALRALRGEDVPAHEFGSKDIWRDEVRQELHEAAAALVANHLETTAAGQAWSNIELPFPQKTTRKALLPALESHHKVSAAAAPSQVPPRTPRNPARPQPSKSQQRARAVQGASSRAGSARGVKGNGLTFKGFDIADVEAYRSIRDRVVDFGQRFREAEPAAALWREAEAERQAQKEAAANTPAGSKRQAQDTLDEDVEMSDGEDAGSRESLDNNEGDEDDEDDEEDDKDDELAGTDKDEDEEDHVASSKSRSKKSIKQMFALTTQQLQPKQAYRKLAQADELDVKTGKVKVKTDNDGSVDPEDAARHLFELALAQVGLEHGHLVAVAYPKIVKAAFAISPFHNIVRQVTPAHGSHDHVELARWLTLVVETVRMQQGSLVIGKTLAASCPTPPDADKRIDDIEFSGLSAADKKNLVKSPGFQARWNRLTFQQKQFCIIENVPLFMYEIIDQIRLEQQIRVSALDRTFHYAALKTMATSCLHDITQQNDRRLQELVAACLESNLERLGILQKYAEEHFAFNAEQPLGLNISSERLDRLNAADGVQTAMRTVLLKALVAQLKAAPVAYDAGRVKQWRDETRRAVKAWQAHKKAPKEVQDDIHLAKDITNILAELTKILRAGYRRSAELEERTKAAADHEDGTNSRRGSRKRSAPATAPGEQRSPATVRREKAEATATIDSVLNSDKDTTIPRRHMSAVVMALCSTLDQLKLSTYRATSLVLSGDNFSFLVSNYDSVRDTWVANANTIIARAQNAVGRLPVSPGWSTQTVDLKIRHQTRYGQMYRSSDARARYVLLEGVHDLKITRFVTVNHSPDKVIPLLAVNPKVDAQISSLCNMLPQTRPLALGQIAEVVHLLFDTSKFPTFVPHGQVTIQRHAVSILGFDLERVSAPTLVELNTDIITAFNTVLGKRSTQTTGWLTKDGLETWNKRRYYVLQPDHKLNQYHRVTLEPLMSDAGKGRLELSASAASRLDGVTRIYNKWSAAQEAKAKPINFNNVHAKVRSALFGAANNDVGDIRDPALFDSKTIVVGIDIGETLAAAFTALPPLDHADSPVRVAEVRSSTIYAYDHGDRNTQAEVAAHSNLKCLRDTLGKDEATKADAAFFALLELRNPVRRAIVWQHNQQRQSAFKKLGTDLVRDLCSRFVNSANTSRKVVVFLGDEGGGNLKDKKPRRKRGTKYGSVIFKHFVEAFKTVPRLKLTICSVNESHSSKRCPDPSCRMERVCKGQQCCLKHPKRKCDNSSVFRLLQCKACTVAFHRDFVGAFNIIWIGLVGAVVYKLHAFSSTTTSTFADATQQRSAQAKATAKRVKR